MAICRNCGRSRCCAHVAGPRSDDGMEHCAMCQVEILLGQNKQMSEALQKIAGLGEEYQNWDFDENNFATLQETAYQLSMDVIKATMEAKP